MKENTKFAKSIGVMLKNKTTLFPILVMTSYLSNTSSAGSYVSLDIISTLNYIQTLLMHIGPLLSAILFVLAGIFYAIGQLFPSYQRATFHTTAIDLIVGAVIVATLSVTSSGFALASTHLLTNITNST